MNYCLRRLHLRRKGEEGTHRIMTQWGIICSILHSHPSVAPRSSHDESHCSGNRDPSGRVRACSAGPGAVVRLDCRWSLRGS